MASFQRAQTMIQNMFSKIFSFNNAPMPYWIYDSSYSWYERDFKVSREHRMVDAATCTNELVFYLAVLVGDPDNAFNQIIDRIDLPISKSIWSFTMGGVIIQL